MEIKKETIDHLNDALSWLKDIEKWDIESIKSFLNTFFEWWYLENLFKWVTLIDDWIWILENIRTNIASIAYIGLEYNVIIQVDDYVSQKCYDFLLKISRKEIIKKDTGPVLTPLELGDLSLHW